MEGKKQLLEVVNNSLCENRLRRRRRMEGYVEGEELRVKLRVMDGKGLKWK